MKFKIDHVNINVGDLDKSLEFYHKALALEEVKRHHAPDGSFIIVFLSDGETENGIELTWLREMKKPYDLGDNESHIAFRVDDFNGAFKKHTEMNCVCYENKEMGLYFIEDPDGYWLEVLPVRP